jgi:hypothetical protein
MYSFLVKLDADLCGLDGPPGVQVSNEGHGCEASAQVIKDLPSIYLHSTTSSFWHVVSLQWL